MIIWYGIMIVASDYVPIKRWIIWIQLKIILIRYTKVLEIVVMYILISELVMMLVWILIVMVLILDVIVLIFVR